SAHHGHPDFRVRNKIFATLSEKQDHSALRLTAQEARELAKGKPDVYRLVSDREQIGWVSVLLERAEPDYFYDLLEEAWRLRSEEVEARAQRRPAPPRRRSQRR